MKQLFWFKKKKKSTVAHTPNPGSWETKPYIAVVSLKPARMWDLISKTFEEVESPAPWGAWSINVALAPKRRWVAFSPTYSVSVLTDWPHFFFLYISAISWTLPQEEVAFFCCCCCCREPRHGYTETWMDTAAMCIGLWPYWKKLHEKHRLHSLCLETWVRWVPWVTAVAVELVTRTSVTVVSHHSRVIYPNWKDGSQKTEQLQIRLAGNPFAPWMYLKHWIQSSHFISQYVCL